MQRDGTRKPKEEKSKSSISADEEDTTFRSFFSDTHAKSPQHVPRSIFVDTDPATKDDVLNGPNKKLFHPESILGALASHTDWLKSKATSRTAGLERLDFKACCLQEHLL